MKLYEVPPNTRVCLTAEDGEKHSVQFYHVDGMYSYCMDDNGNVIHLAAWEEVEIDKEEQA